MSVSSQYVTIRKAYITDQKGIEDLVFSEWLNPFGLYWQRFWVVETRGNLIACAQLRVYKNLEELSSLAVAPKYRGQGIGKHLAGYIVKQAYFSTYVLCVSQLIPFYRSVGFEQISSWFELSDLLKLKFGLSSIAANLRQRSLIIMQYRK